MSPVRLARIGGLALALTVRAWLVEAAPADLQRLALPPSFEVNQGQADPAVAYLSRGRGHTLFLTAGEAVLRLRGATVRMRLVGAQPDVPPRGLDERPGRSHYVIGNVAARWATDVAHYARVAYPQVYPGIDLIFHGDQGALEYDLVVAPGADPGLVRIAFEGADRVELDDAGDLRLHTAAGTILQRRPRVYQDHAGGRVPVAGAWVLRGEREAGFTLGAWNRERPLIIDPELGYGTYLGGTGYDRVAGMAVDAAGHAYVVGETDSVDFPATDGAYAEGKGAEGCPAPPCRRAFVAKLAADGSGLVYATYLGGTGTDGASGVAVDADGHAYVVGTSVSSDFPTTTGAFQTTAGGLSNAFVAKLSPSGSALVYATYLGGSGNDHGDAIAVDGTGHAYVTGVTIAPPDDQTANDFPTTQGAYQAACKVGTYCWDLFVTKLSPTGTALVYSTYLGGSLVESVYGIAVDADGHAYVAGDTPSTDFPTTPGAFQPTAPANTNVFVTKLDAAGTALVYSTYLGGSFNDGIYGGALALDAARHVYVTSWAESTDFPTTPGAFQETCATLALGTGVCDAAFVAKLAPDGASLVYATYLGGALGGGNTQPGAIAVDATGSAYVTGWTNATDFPTRQPIQPALRATGTESIPLPDGFVARLDPAGSALAWSTYLGGSLVEGPRGIGLDATGNVYVAGLTNSSDFPVSAGALQPTLGSPGAGDGFVVKIAPGAPPTVLAAAVLPAGRSVQVGQTATAFATIINAGTETAVACSVAPIGSLLSTFGYQTTDADTNALTGSPSTPVDIAPGARQSYVFWLSPAVALVPLLRELNFSCHNGSADVLPGVNTLLYSASWDPVADIVALAATAPPGPPEANLPPDGVVRIPGPSGAAAFAVAAVNVGAAASITVSAEPGPVALPLTITVCETHPQTGACKAPPTSAVATTIAAGATPTFAVFLTAHGSIPFAPATHRVFVVFAEAGGFQDVRGLTSVAVTTP